MVLGLNRGLGTYRLPYSHLASLKLETCDNKVVVCRVTFPNWSRICAVYIIFWFFFAELSLTFTATPPNPFYVLEGNNITFVWQYNFDGTFDRVVFRFVSGSPSRIIVIKRDLNLDSTVPNSFYTGRIQENINAIRAEITIFALQRSESGEYEIEVTDSTFDPIIDKMTVQVQCK